MTRSRRVVLVIVAFLAASTAVFLWHDVDTRVTEADRTALTRMLADAGYRPDGFGALDSFDRQIDAILAVQDAVLRAAPIDEGLPLGAPREPAQLAAAGKGLCFDRSRVIEKALSWLGLEVRHAAVYALQPADSAVSALLTPEGASHAVTEVRTAKGWLLVDSNARWIGLGADGRPHSLAMLHDPEVASVAWSPRNRARINRIFTRRFTYVLGLYSRHGRFYPPYTPLPDTNLAQLMQNITD